MIAGIVSYDELLKVRIMGVHDCLLELWVSIIVLMGVHNCLGPVYLNYIKTKIAIFPECPFTIVIIRGSNCN